ncbi:DUF2478 domain-containing protein [Antarcticimicrobium luteum]|uniref:DUF2478 domain-containing protein n=1 Tax=Antarcticimicrobium luteum TaxID=2547397 RepID=A0A4R5VD92_9RHOB|nr:DUF2478 domain-containing protein [Antarcticimicrobium luteum]TDK50180.1 DUF2478 domain-containing protein [Antarcticimicrobium luteum]
MLGYVVADGQGAADLVIREVADRLRAEGVQLAGAVQVNKDTDPDRKCEMDLHVLSRDAVVRISQNLGALSRGCRLDPDGLERAVGLVAQALAEGPDLLIVNKYGKQEIDGRGFRPLIGEALAMGIPVLTAVNRGNVEQFLAFAEDLAEALPGDAQVVFDWCMAQRTLTAG